RRPAGDVTALALTLLREAGPADLRITFGPRTTVGELADALALRDPAGFDGPTGTLGVETPDGTVPLDPAVAVAGCGLPSGVRVRLIAASGHSPNTEAAEQAGVLQVLAGPDAGRGPFPLSPGGNVIGRDRGCAVQLTDPLVSKQHARVTIGDIVEIADLGA